MPAENKGVGLTPPSQQENFAHGQRKKAVAVMRERVRMLRRQADRWNALANALEEIEEYAKKECVDGNEDGPHIGVGSMAEELLWELANKNWPD